MPPRPARLVKRHCRHQKHHTSPPTLTEHPDIYKHPTAERDASKGSEGTHLAAAAYGRAGGAALTTAGAAARRWSSPGKTHPRRGASATREKQTPPQTGARASFASPSARHPCPDRPHRPPSPPRRERPTVRETLELLHLSTGSVPRAPPSCGAAAVQRGKLPAAAGSAARGPQSSVPLLRCCRCPLRGFIAGAGLKTSRSGLNRPGRRPRIKLIHADTPPEGVRRLGLPHRDQTWRPAPPAGGRSRHPSETGPFPPQKKKTICVG